MPPVIRGTTKAETEAFLQKASELINQFEQNVGGDFVKFKKENNIKFSGIAGLSFSIVKAEDGNYYVLGHRKNSNHLLGEGGFSQVKIAYRLVKEVVHDHYEWSLGEEIVVKKATKKNNYFDQNNQQRYETVKSHEDKKATKATKSNQQSDKFYLFTKLVDGQELQGLINEGYFNNASLSKRIRFFSNILPELIELHDKNVVHGDIKLQNIMYSPTNNQGKIIDYEMAVPEGQDRAGKSAYYAAPEFNSSPRASKAGDIYALGIMLTQMLLAHPGSRIYKKDETAEFMTSCPIFADKLAAYNASGKDIEVLIETAPVISVSDHLFVDNSRDLTKFKTALLDFLKKMTATKYQDRPTAKEAQDFFVNFIKEYENEVGVAPDVEEIRQQANKKGMATKQILTQILADMKFNEYLGKFNTLEEKLRGCSDFSAADEVANCLISIEVAQRIFLEEAGSNIQVATTRLQQACMKAITAADNNLKEQGHYDPNWASIVENFVVDCLNYVITQSNLTQYGFTLFSKKPSQASQGLNTLKEELMDENQNNINTL